MQKDTHFCEVFCKLVILSGVLGGHLLHFYSAKCCSERGSGSSVQARGSARPGRGPGGRRTAEEGRGAWPGGPMRGQESPEELRMAKRGLRKVQDY